MRGSKTTTVQGQQEKVGAQGALTLSFFGQPHHTHFSRVFTHRVPNVVPPGKEVGSRKSTRLTLAHLNRDCPQARRTTLACCAHCLSL